jgi:hypothetical protein
VGSTAVLSSVFRSLNAVFAVVVAVAATQRFGDSTRAKLLTVAITSSVVVIFEALVIWLPKHSVTARRLLDSRSKFVGSWRQDVIKSHGRGMEQNPNRFAIFTVAYVKATDNYVVDGTAYTDAGIEHARWKSTDVVHFSRDGMSMTYEWEGPVTNREFKDGSADRSGFSRLTLTGEDGGTARVDHVHLDISLEINIDRITTAWLAKRQLGDFTPESLQTPSERDRFALALAPRRAEARARAK